MDAQLPKCETMVIVVNRLAPGRVRVDVLANGEVSSVEADDNIDDVWSEAGGPLVEAAAKMLERL